MLLLLQKESLTEVEWDVAVDAEAVEVVEEVLLALKSKPLGPQLPNWVDW